MHKNFLIFLLFVGLTLQYACFDPPEGCRDIRATNYNVTADIDCEDCCKYSNLYIDIDHSMDGISIDTSIYFKHGNDSLRIKKLIYFLTNIKLHDGIDFVSSSSEQKHKIGLPEEGIYKFIQRNFNVAKIEVDHSLTKFHDP